MNFKTLFTVSAVLLGIQFGICLSVNQPEAGSKERRSQDFSTAASSPSSKTLIKCSRQSILLTRQTLNYQLELINNYNSIWFNDLDRDELVEEQKQSLASIIMSGSSQQLLNSDGQMLFDIESSYFRPMNMDHLSLNSISASARNLLLNGTSGIGGSNGVSVQPMQTKLISRHQDKCQLNLDKNLFTYVFGLSFGPFEHNLDVLYRLPKELRLSQPIDWRYAQIKIIVSRMNYEITLKQIAGQQIGASTGCPLEVVDVTYLGNSFHKPQIVVIANDVATTNGTLLHLERLFNDYTRPTVSGRLREMLKFYLSSKSLPLSTN